MGGVYKPHRFLSLMQMRVALFAIGAGDTPEGVECTRSKVSGDGVWGCARSISRPDGAIPYWW